MQSSSHTTGTLYNIYICLLATDLFEGNETPAVRMRKT